MIVQCEPTLGTLTEGSDNVCDFCATLVSESVKAYPCSEKHIDADDKMQISVCGNVENLDTLSLNLSMKDGASIELELFSMAAEHSTPSKFTICYLRFVTELIYLDHSDKMCAMFSNRPTEN